jgi:hypothetical protein
MLLASVNVQEKAEEHTSNKFNDDFDPYVGALQLGSILE